MNLKPYPEYKDSGIEWIGDIPKDWKKTKLKFLLNKKTDGSHTSVEILSEGYPYVTVTDLDEKEEKIDLDNCKKISRKDFDFLVRNGCKPEIDDILFSQIGTIGVVIPVKDDNNFVMLSSLAILTPSPRVNSRWLIHFLRSNFIKDQYKTMMAGGAVKRITLDHISNFNIISPPLKEEKSIASFLDKKTSEIDLTIEKDTCLIELLKEKRTALINHVVTKGLDPKAEMKDSGIDSVGKVPVDWKITKLKYISDINYGLALELDRGLKEGTRIISLPNVTKDGRLILEDVPFAPKLTKNQEQNLLLKKGDLLFNWRSGSPQHVGKTAYFNETGDYTHVSFLLRLRFDQKNYDSLYYHKYLNNLRNTGFFSFSKNQVNKTFNKTELDNLSVIVPPIKVQRLIATDIDNKTSKLDAIIFKIQKNIELLEEYKKSIIHHVVTGKVDVREVAV